MMWMTLVWFLLFVCHCHYVHSFGTFTVERNQKQLLSSSSLTTNHHHHHHRIISQLFSSSLNPNEKATTTIEEEETTNDDPFTSDIEVTSQLVGHHVAIKTRNIEMAIAFYSLLGFQVETKFRAGPAKAAWLLHNNKNQRLELLEVPSYMLPKKGISRAIDLTQQESLLGFNHLALNVTHCIQTMRQKKESTVIDESCGCTYGLNEYMKELNQTSLQKFQKTLRVAVPPRQQIIGGHVYELSFIYDADGSLLELLHWTNELTHKQDSGWEPWDGKGFINAVTNNSTSQL